MSRETVKDMCEGIGVVDCSLGNLESRGVGFISVRVALDILKPLCRGRIVTLESGERMKVSFRYEHLPNLCYWCGCFDHDDSDCEMWIDNDGSLTPDDKKYGPFIHAPPFFPSEKEKKKKRNMITVEGFYKGLKTKVAWGKLHTRKVVPMPTQVASQVSLMEANSKKEGEYLQETFNVVHQQNSNTLAVSINTIISPPTVSNCPQKSFSETPNDIDQEIRRFDSPNGINIGENLSISVSKTAGSDPINPVH